VANEERIVGRGRAHDGLGANIGAAARPVLNDNLLAEALRKPQDVYKSCNSKKETFATKKTHIMSL
jgi:hypothetical protein